MAKRFKAEYTAGDVMGMYMARSQDADEGRIRDLATQFRELCRMEHAVTIPKQYKAITKEMRTPFVRDMWHRVTSSLVQKQPSIRIHPIDEERQDYRDAANVAERWDLAFLERENKRQGTDLVYDSTAALVRDGESVLKVVHRPDAWANFPERKEEDADDYNKKAERYKKTADMPFAMRVVDRLSVVYENGEYGDDWVIEYGEYAKPYLCSAYGMTDMYGQLVNPKATLQGTPMPQGLQTSSGGRSVKVEFFTANEWHVIIDGSEAPGFPKRNPYSPYLPYFRAPAYEMESLLYSLMFLVPRMDELLTMKLNWSYLGAYPSPVIETVPNASGLPSLDMPLGDGGDAAGGEQGVLRWSPGKAMELPIGKRMYFLSPPPVGQDLNQLVELLKGMIDIAGIPNIMRGFGGDSGYHAAQLRGAAEMAYKLASMSLQRQWEKAFEFVHWMVSNVVKQSVYINGWSDLKKNGEPARKASRAWIALAPDKQSKSMADVSKLGPVEVRYRPQQVTDEQANAMIAMQLTNAQIPLASQRHALEKWLREDDPDGILREMDVEREFRENPVLRQMKIDEALSRAHIRQPQPQGGLVDQFGQPMGGMGAIPQAEALVQGTPGVQGITAGMPAGRPRGMYPGQPGGPRG